MIAQWQNCEAYKQGRTLMAIALPRCNTCGETLPHLLPITSVFSLLFRSTGFSKS